MNLKEQLQQVLTKARDIAALAEKEKRDFTSDERETVGNLLDEAKGLKAKIAQAQGDADMASEIKSLSDEFAEAVKKNGGEGSPPAAGGTLGEQFVKAAAFQAWMKRIAPGGHVPRSGGIGSSPPVKFARLLEIGRKALITGSSDTSAGAFVETDYTGIYEAIGRYPLSVLDLVSRRTTMSDLVEFVRQTAQVTQAVPVAEANVTEYSGATGEVSGEKPEGTSTWEKVQEAVKTIAVWIPATRRALSDASQLRGLLDQELKDDLAEEFEDQILNGDGTGENFTGIFNTAGILVQPFVTDILTTTRTALTTLEVTGRAKATAWALHPTDWQTIELTTDTAGRYYFAGPQQRGPKTLWGIPVVTSQSVTQGTGLLGDFRKAVVWDREAANILVSDSHEDFFIRNMIAILAEMRAAFGVIRPSGFVEIDMESGS